MNALTRITFKQTASAIAIAALVSASAGFVFSAMTAQPALAAEGDGGGQGATAGQGGNAGGAGGGGAGDGKQGAGKPNWADADLVDMGRLNILKVSEDVLHHAVFEASNEDYSMYELTSGDFVATLTDLDQIVDSPVANMGLLNAYWGEYADTGTYDGFIDYAWESHEDGGTTVIEGVIALDPASFTDFSAIAIGIAIDKEMVPTVDIVESLATVVWGKETPDNAWPDDFDAAAIAAAAADVQEQVVYVHDQ